MKRYISILVTLLVLSGIQGQISPLVIEDQGTLIGGPGGDVGSVGVVGSIQGNFNVTPTGAATYSIPFECPAGINGMTPQVGLVYSSHAGNGIAGLGWNITGISSISRVPKTIYYDEVSKDIQWNITDVYALNGIRLFLISVNGTTRTYSLENDPKVRVYAYNCTAEGPAYFIVHAADGTKTYFGQTDDSQLNSELFGGVRYTRNTLAWSQSKVQDLNGNYIKYEYISDVNDGLQSSFRISKISYTGNGSHLPTDSINFYYEQRPDEILRYVGIKKFDQYKRLSYVTVKSGSSAIKTYSLNQSESEVNNFTYLNNVWLLGLNNEMYNRTVFSYPTGTIINSQKIINEIPEDTLKSFKGIIPGDYNGDGVTDFCINYSADVNGHLTYFFSFYLSSFNNGNLTLSYFGTYESTEQIIFYDIVIDQYSNLAADLNSNGKTDLVILSKISSQIKYEILEIDLNDPQNPFKIIDSQSFLYTGGGFDDDDELYPYFSIGELNGDGRPDLIFINLNPNIEGESVTSKHTAYFAIQDGAGGFIFDDATIQLNSYPVKEFYVMDMNGDGLSDIISMRGQTQKVSYCTGVSKTGVSKYFNLVPDITLGADLSDEYEIMCSGNLNGDNLLDLIVRRGDDIFGYYNTGNDFTAVDLGFNLPVDSNNDDENDRIYITDLNSDGLSDIIKANEVFTGWIKTYDYTNWKYYQNDETGFSIKSDLSSSSKIRTNEFSVADYCGNGVVDELTFNKIDNIFDIKDHKYSNFKSDKLLEKITTGTGIETYIYYQRILDLNSSSNSYTYDIDNSPLIALRTPNQFIVNKVENELMTNLYEYHNALFSFEKGYLGMEKFISENSQNNIKSIIETTIELDFYTPNVINSKTYYNGTELLSESEKTYEIDSISGKRYKFLPKLEWKHDYLNNTIDSVLYEDHDYYALPQAITEKHYKRTTLDLEITLTSSLVYDHSISPWKIGDVEEKSTISKRGTATETMSIEIEYYPDTRALHKKQNNANTDFEIEEEYTYDDFGNVLTSSLTARKNPYDTTSLTTRTNTFTYSDNGRYRESAANALGHKTLYSYSVLTGLLRFEEDDENNLITEYVFDNLGRLQRTIAPNNLETLTTYHWNENHVDQPENAHTYSIEQVHGVSDIIIFFDIYGRKLRTVSRNFDNTKLSQDYFYNDKSQLWKETLPYKPGEDTCNTIYTYDNYGRIIRIDYPDNRFTTKNYSNPDYVVTETGKGTNKQTVKKYYNSLGEIYKSIDNEGNTVLIDYFPNGQPKEYDYGNYNKVFLSYDINGNRISISDPDAGDITSVYNSFGELIADTSANDNLTKYEYDNLSRITKEVQYSGDSIEKNTKLYFYDNNFTGALDAIQQRKPEIQTSAEIFSTYQYNDFGQLLSRTEHIDYNEGTYTYDIVRQFITSYDDYGRVETKSYPYNFDVDYTYQNGYLHTITSGGTILWDCESINSLGQITNFKMGNRVSQYNYNPFGELQSINQSGYKTLNYTFDDFGNIYSREDQTNQLKEVFWYDNMNRLTTILNYINGAQSSGGKNYSYDNNGHGNLVYQSDIGDYTYGDKPHAVTGISNTDYHPNPQTINYTTFNKVSKITQTDESEEEINILIEYGANNERRKATFQNTAAPYMNYKKYYFGDYEEKVQGATTTRYYFVNSPTGLCAINVSTNSTSTLWHVNLDHLGSPTLLIDSDDYLNRKEYSYSAWGIRRDPYDWRIEDNTELIAERGFTGHEHLEEFELINMNGRVYDPILAKFLSPDSYVQLPDIRSGFNRYSYCLNNPLIYTDPDGELIWVIPNIGFSRDGGLSFGVSVVVGVPGVWSAQAGIGYNTGYRPGEGSVYGYVGATAAMNTVSASYSTSGGFSVGYSAGATVFSGLPISTNFASVGVNYNFSNSSFSGNLSAWQIDQNGVRFNPSFSMMVFPEQTTNFVRGKGFRSNDNVLNSFVEAGNHQGALDYFGFEGTYDPNRAGGDRGITDPSTGDIFYGNNAFNGGFDDLYFTADHEGRHRADVLSGKYDNLELTPQVMAREEFNTYAYNYRRQGLYRNHGFKIGNSLNAYGSAAGVNPDIIFSYSFYQPWWHGVYRIPRRW